MMSESGVPGIIDQRMPIRTALPHHRLVDTFAITLLFLRGFDRDFR